MTLTARTSPDVRFPTPTSDTADPGGDASVVPVPSAPPAALTDSAAHLWCVRLDGRGKEASGDARRFVREHLREHGVDPDDAELVVSELVTNAVDHGGDVTEFSLGLSPKHVRVTVGDPGEAGNLELPSGPADYEPDLDGESGRGLLIALALSESLRVEHRGPAAKRVVATLRRRPLTEGV